jgi:RNA polymerase sigma factor (sigma-70 family)
MPGHSTVHEDSLRTRDSLIARLRDLDDSESWTDFHRTYARVVRGLARKRGLTEAEAEEVAQDVFKRIAETIHEFERTTRSGSFRRWLYQLARWRSDDKIRERGRIPVEPLPELAETDTGEAQAVERVAAPDGAGEMLEAEARRQLIRAALDRIRRRVSARDLQIFQLLVLDEWSPAKVAQFFAISTTLVYVVRHRVGQQLRSELETIRKRLAADPPAD